jgi:hypothetical protein
MMSEFKTVEFRMCEERYLFFFSTELFCIQYDDNTFVCLRGTKPVFVNRKDLNLLKRKSESIFKKYPRINYMLGKDWLRRAVEEEKCFIDSLSFISAYVESLHLKFNITIGQNDE